MRYLTIHDRDSAWFNVSRLSRLLPTIVRESKQHKRERSILLKLAIGIPCSDEYDTAAGIDLSGTMKTALLFG